MLNGPPSLLPYDISKMSEHAFLGFRELMTHNHIPFKTHTEDVGWLCSSHLGFMLMFFFPTNHDQKLGGHDLLQRAVDTPPDVLSDPNRGCGIALHSSHLVVMATNTNHSVFLSVF